MLPEKVIKLLMLTTSPNDAEALSAIRAANKIVMNGNKSWEDFKNPDSRRSDSRFDQPFKQRTEKSYATDIDSKLNACLNCQPGNKFVNSLREFYDKTGYLSKKQYEALDRIYGQL